MVTAQMKNVYSEVYVIFNKLDLISKLPDMIATKILKEKSNEHYFDFNEQEPLYEQIKNVDTISMVSYLYVKYLCDDQEEKEWLISKYKDNEIRYQEELKEKYSTDNLFKHKEIENIEQEEIQQTAMIEYKERNIFQKVFYMLISIFKKKH